MKKIGITGQIGAGKSFVGSLLRTRGFRVLDADLACHGLYRDSAELRSKIAEEFGPSALMADGINRKFFSDLIFKDAGARLHLEKMVYPYLVRHTLKFFEGCATAGAEPVAESSANVAFVEAALFENVPELVLTLDEIWVVTAPENVRQQRLVDSRGLSPEDAARRIDLQRNKNSEGAWRELFPGKTLRFIDNSSATIAPQIPLVLA